jgi:hypothetical protein
MGSMTRRKILTGVALSAGFLATSGCLPARVVLQSLPKEFESVEVLDRVLRAFVVTIIPDAQMDRPNLARVLFDPYFPLATYAPYLADDLCRRSQKRFSVNAFEDLEPEQRAEIVQSALADGGPTERLYSGAIYLAQASFYAGIYAPELGCPEIGFAGRFRGLDGVSDLHRAFPRALTEDGNPT